ncbi:OmpH family outer membrane protein [Balneola sp. MJW-20]|uniref:OmpH family outer membrane protein n=1 Tax=Gracilimonas aurantiaca TaxID=3234185 RepID=UPI003467D7F2
MRSAIIFGLLLLLTAGTGLKAQDQKLGYFESEFILGQIPEYEGIQQQLKLLSDGWKEELESMEREITLLEEDFAAKEILYTDEVRAQRSNEIQQMKRQRDQYMAQKFGPEGEYFTRQRDLLEPLQRRVFGAVRTVAQRQGFDMVFDRSGDIYMVYARSEWNLNEDILRELGIEIDEGQN